MRKIFAGILSAVGLICLVLAAACAEKKPEYFTLIYAEQAGITYNFGDIQSGAQVKKGYEVTFTVAFDDALEGDEPAVMANDTKLKANEEGVYSFIMNEDINITVNGVFMPDNYEVVFEAGNAAAVTDEKHEEYRVWYYDLEGNDITGKDNAMKLSGGEKVSFTLKVSVYYGDSNYMVTANTLVLKPDDKGVYSFNVIGPTRVTVEGLEMDDGFTVRENGGAGTPDNPFIIEKPVDLYYMADLISDPFYSDGYFALAYYRLDADIDMQGEQIFVIGDRPTDDSTSLFAGNFDGNGHTISNYIIKDSIIEQEGYTDVPLRYVGLFGFAAAINNSVNIYDLTLEDFEIEIHGSKYASSGFYTGGLVAYGVGVNVTNCKVSGRISADGNTDYFSNVGGVAGYLQSAYGGNVTYHSGITGTQSDVEIECAIGNIYTAGGLVGMLASAAETANAYVLNSFSTGSVSGAIYTGGVAGYMGPYTSVINCYASGADVYGRSDVGVISGNQTYAYAYAGGIAGYAAYDTVIANCLSAVDDISANSSLGSTYVATGAIVGGHERSGESYVQTKALIFSNNYSTADNVTLNETFFKTVLGWNENNWDFSGTYPAVKDGAASVNNTLTINNGNNDISVFNVSGYHTMSYWYENGLPVYLTYGVSENIRSYGYFFDADKTQSVPAGYIPASDTVLYVGFADYSKVAGTYYLRTGNGEEAYFKLGADGSLTYRYGALNYETIYVYDGKTITLQRNPAFIESVTDNDEVTTTYYICAMAKVDGDTSVLSFYDGINFTEAQPLLATKEIEGFTYGSYYASNNGADYTFYKDGTGVYGNIKFSYTVDGTTLKINFGYSEEELTLTDNSFKFDGVTYKAYDEFRGVWEKSAKAHEQYYFDGKGNWTYSYVGYNADGTTVDVKPSANGTYERRDNSIVLSDGTVVGYDTVNKWITIADVPYYKENSLAGDWRFFSIYEAVSITFNGIGADGYGVAIATYGASALKYELNYEVINTPQGPVITLMDGAEVFGELVYSAADSTLTGTVYLAASHSITTDALFCLYDDFKGIWISEIGTVEFNGLGKYNIKGTESYTRTEGTVKVNGRSAGKYTVDGRGVYGEFTYSGTKYTIYYNSETGAVDVTTLDSEFKLVKADELYGINLVAEDGTVYTFNGGGNLATGGTFRINGEEQAYTYFNENGQVVIKEEDAICGSILVDNGVYTLTLENKTTKLVIENEFTGSWIKGGVNSGAVEIGVINGDRTAAGSYLGTNVTFVYDVEGKYLSFEYEGETLFILAMHAKRTELAVSHEPKTLVFEVCMKAGDIDNISGTYVNSDGSSMTLDGFSTSIYSSGTAVLSDKSGKTTAVYSYVVNKLNEIELKHVTDDGTVIYVFEEVAAGTEGAYTGNGHSYVITDTDYFYSRTGTDAAGIIYKFDGHGTVTVSNGKTFSYVIESYDDILYEYTLTLTQGEEKYTAVYTRIIGEYNMTVSPDYLKGVTAADAEGNTYTFDGEGKATSGNEVYAYTVDRYNANANEYTLTLSISVASGDTTVTHEYTAVYNCNTHSITLTENAAE